MFGNWLFNVDLLLKNIWIMVDIFIKVRCGNTVRLAIGVTRNINGILNNRFADKYVTI